MMLQSIPAAGYSARYGLDLRKINLLSMKKRITNSWLTLYLAVGMILLLFTQCQSPPPPLDSYQKWETITLDFTGPTTSETAEHNPFTHYRMNVVFSQGEQQFVVPAYYAADGQAGETSAEAGAIWRVHFTPNSTGIWDYEVSFRTGEMIAVSDELTAGTTLAPDGDTGQFEVVAPTGRHEGFRAKGRLVNKGGRYLEFAESGDLFIKGGANSPENMLAFKDFDGTYSSDPKKQFIKEYKPHLQDWATGDPTWQDGKGKGLIGAINYLSEVGMNAVYFLTMNIEGDAGDVFPYRSHENLSRFDCSKLDQWNVVFTHAQKKGLALHVVTQETENELLLDEGDTGPMRRLYYRELVARFAHHYAIFWNLGEENGPAPFSPEGQSTQQRKDMIDWLKGNDPYDNPVLLHTHAGRDLKDHILQDVLGYEALDGLSMQIGNRYHVYDDLVKWWKASKESGHEWISYMDEIGWYWMGAMPDQDMPTHDTLRQEVLWSTFMAGASGVEWYFGYKYAQSDLNCEDWRSRDNLWKQTKIAMDFFSDLPLREMEPMDELLTGEQAHCFAKKGETYVVYFKSPAANKLSLVDLDGTVKVRWMNPQTGKWLEDKTQSLAGGTTISLSPPIDEQQKDWVALVTKE